MFSILCCNMAYKLVTVALYSLFHFSCGYPLHVQKTYTDRSSTGDQYSNYCPTLDCGPVKCVNKLLLLRLGHCVTFDADLGLSSIRCPYFQLAKYNLTKVKYIRLPSNISELNEYICKPINRKGYLCKDCIDDFGPSVTSVGYACSNCSKIWFGVPLYLMLELFPITVLYIVIYILPIRLTSAPGMSCYIMYSQLIVLELAVDRKLPVDLISPTRPLFRLVLFVYGMWNLDFFRYILPPFCVSSKLHIIHIVLLEYVSILYPMFLIAITWICVEAYDHNCRPLIYICRPLHKVLFKARRATNVRHDIIDVFATFLILSSSKVVYQAHTLLKCTKITTCGNQTEQTRDSVMMMDFALQCRGIEHGVISVAVVITATVMNIIPALILILYPVKIFRRCLATVMKVNGLFLNTFIERFYSCFKDGLDGKGDMRSFSGMYFILRHLPALSKLFHTMHNMNEWLLRGLLFSFVALLLAYMKPYKYKYMNILDISLLVHMSVSCYLLSREWFPGADTQLLIVALIPSILLGALTTVKLFTPIMKGTFITLVVVKCHEKLQRKHDHCCDVDTLPQPLNTPTSSMLSSFKTYGTTD